MLYCVMSHYFTQYPHAKYIFQARQKAYALHYKLAISFEKVGVE